MLRHLLVGGWPGLAVHHLAFLLNEHAKVILGVERYSRVHAHLDSYHLHVRRILDPLPQESRARAALMYTRLRLRASAGDFAYTGDAASVYGLDVGSLADRIRTARLVIVLGPPPRDDAHELERWREVARSTRSAEENGYRRRMFVMPWEGWLGDGETWRSALLAYLELPDSERLHSEHARMVRELDCGESPRELADPEIASLERWRQERTRAELELVNGLSHAAHIAPPDEPGLSPAEIEARDAERAQVLAELAVDQSEWPAELGALRRRHRDDSAMLFSRGLRLRERSLTAANRLPNRDFRVTAINPYDVKEVVGRAAVDSLAGALGKVLAVRLVRIGERDLTGAEVVATETFDDPALLGEPNVVLCPAVPALEDLWLAAAHDARVVFLLSDAGGLEVVRASPGHQVLATTHWLAEQARRAGARALHVPWGLERQLTQSGLPMHERGLTVTALASPAAGHDPDALEAVLVSVREGLPESAITVFGGIPLDGATDYVHYPSFGRLTKLLHGSAVHVVAAPAHGRAEIGALALAAGCALVTSDNADAAEYAVDGQTAMVAPAGDGEALAARTLELLADLDLRSRLAAEGRRYLRQVFPAWSEVARRLALTLTESD